MTQLEAREQIKTLFEAGIDSVKEICDRTGIAKRTVYRVKRLIREGKSVEHKKVPGRPKVMKIPLKLSLIKTLKHSPKMSVRDVHKNLRIKYPDTLSTSTVFRAIHSSGFRYRKSIKGPFITDKTSKNRVEWCKNNKRQDWNKIFFSDECSVWLERDSVRM